jgi:hypothetical protein
VPRYNAEILGNSEVNQFSRELVDAFALATRETIKDFADRIKGDAIANIKYGAAISRYPQTGALASSIKYSIRSNVVSFTVGDADTPYARLQDDPNPTEIYPTESKTLTFFWHKIGQPVARRSVIRRGNQYFSRAWASNLNVLQAIFDAKLSEASSTYIRSASNGKRYHARRGSGGRFQPK